MTNPASDNDPLGIVGTTIAEKYEVERFVAEGGFSLLYRAQHKVWKQPVAVKFLKAMAQAHPAQRKEILDSFIQEGQLLRQLSSRTAGILQAHDVGTWQGGSGEWYPYLILEWLDGKPFDLILDEFREQNRPPLSLLQILHSLEPAAKALEVVHRRGIAHRDIKPANLFLVGDPQSADSFVKVLDFGIAKVLGDMAEMSAASAKTGVGIASFTPWYGAPEQFSKRFGATGPWTDVFAMALVMVEMLSLRAPLEGDDVIQLSVNSANPNERPSPRHHGVEVSDAVEAVFLKALAVKPTDRYATMGHFWNDLCQVAGSDLMVEMGTQNIPMAMIEGAMRASAFPRGNFTGGDTTSRGSLLNPQPLALASTQMPEATSTGVRVSTPGSLPENTTASPISSTVGRAELPSLPSAAGPSRVAMLAGGVGLLAAVLVGYTLLSRQPTPATPVPAASASAASASASASAPTTVACPEGMVRIPGGNFYMGYDGEGALPFEGPPHSVQLDAFCIDVTEVTVERYRACTEGGKCQRAAVAVNWPGATAKQKSVYGPLCNIDDPGRDRHPINCVDWEMADNFCQRQGLRLPTSAEWEFAVRGPDGRTYPWGDEPPDANHLNACGKECIDWGKKNGVAAELTAMHQEDDGFPTTAPVGSFPKGRSRYGLDDVIGNVMEWVQDWDGEYDKGAQVNPRGPDKGTDRVIRGGAWNAGHAFWVRPSFRFKYPPDTRSHGVGFRCAK